MIVHTPKEFAQARKTAHCLSKVHLSKALSKERSLSSGAKALWRHLCFRSNKKSGESTCDLKNLSDVFGMPEPMVKQLMLQLLHQNWLKKIEDGKDGDVIQLKVCIPKSAYNN